VNVGYTWDSLSVGTLIRLYIVTVESERMFHCKTCLKQRIDFKQKSAIALSIRYIKRANACVKLSLNNCDFERQTRI